MKNATTAKQTRAGSPVLDAAASTENATMDWTSIKNFCFTYAIPGGAWLEDLKGNRNWFSFAEIEKQLGRVWLDRQLQRQGWMTGCWIAVG